jgi:bacteriocin biosynthesis cyclodehydratase domain-containing protein
VTTDTAHPLLPAATPVLVTDGGALRVGGADSTDGLLVDPAAAALRALLRGLDGRRAQRAVLADAARSGLDPVAVRSVLDRLRGTGLLVDLDPADLLASSAGPAAEARTAAELPAATSAGARSGWPARRAAAVVVEGATRVGTPLAAMLAASGVGRVSVRDDGLVAAGDVIVGGLAAADEGRPRSVAAADAVRRASPLTDLRPLPEGTAPDVVVLTSAWAAADPLARGLSRGGVPHLVATVRGETGVVGPLVVPGATSCLHCADLHRRDADPAWPEMAAQLTARRSPPSGATLTCLLTATLAAQQVLAFLDRTARPVTLQGTVELRPPELLPRLRRWPAHPACGCLPGPLERQPRPRSDDRFPLPDDGDAVQQATMAG